MRKVQDDLIVGVGVDGGHGPADDLEIIVNYFGDRPQAVGSTRGVGNDVVLGRIVLVLVDAHYDGDVFIGGGRGDNDLLHRSAQVLLGQLALGELAGRLDHDLGADGFPIELGRVLLGEHLDVLAVDADEVCAGGNFVGQVAKDGVVLQQMGQRLGVGEIVDRDEFQVRVIERRTKNVAADAPEAVDAYFDCHSTSSEKIPLRNAVIRYYAAQPRAG